MNTLIAESYFPILIFIVLIFTLGICIIALPFILVKRYYYKAKNTEYECGFDAFDDLRNRFDVRFYLVAILFIIFDLEIAFLFPWAMTLKEVGWFSFVSMMIFLSVLTIGFIYELLKGAIDWE